MSGESDSRGETTGRDGIAVEDLLWVVPRFVDRTTKQIELARILASHLPCIGSLVPGGAAQPGGNASYPAPNGEPVDVLDVLADDPVAPAAPEGPDDASGGVGSPVTPHAADSAETAQEQVDSADSVASSDLAAGPAEVPTEGDLAVSGYDSLAASQVVPRLATLAKPDLTTILAYEQAHRNRQTIIHRVRQLLDD